ncbi:MAG: hypothetical protein ABIE94_01810 [archaeon]
MPDTAKDTYENEEFSGRSFDHVSEPSKIAADGAPQDLPSVGAQGPMVREPVQVKQFTEKPQVGIESTLTKSFFLEFEEFLKDKKLDIGLVEEVLDKDLLNKMKQFYLHEKDGKNFYYHPGELNKAMTFKLESLKQLEKDWYTGQKQLQDIQKQLYNKEAEIEFSLGELKRILSQVKSNVELKSDLTPSEYFRVVDGKVLRNFTELKMALKTMSPVAFDHHVSKERNDFANWVKHVFNNEDLAAAMEAARNRQELTRLLDEL